MSETAHTRCAHSGTYHCQNCGDALEGVALGTTRDLTDNIDRGQAMVLRLEATVGDLAASAETLQSVIARQSAEIDRLAKMLLVAHGDRGAIHLDCFDELAAEVSRIRKAAKR